jgi:GAF domain-containing protein
MLDEASAQALDDVARNLVEGRDVDQILATIVEAVLLSIDEVDHAGISVTHRDGTIDTQAATGALVHLLDQAQYDTGQGPCLDAMAPGTHHDVVLVDNIRQEQRWPAYTPRAVHLGLRSQLGVRIYAETKTVGGLNLYSTSADTISAESVALAHLFAAHAAVALGRRRRESHLLPALRTRELIVQATGIMMERYKVTASRAFDYLARVSQTRNIKLRELASQIVEQGDIDIKAFGDPRRGPGGLAPGAEGS